MNKEEAEAKLKEEFEWYEAKADQVARRVFVEHVKPYCRKHSLTFSSAMGTWAFRTENGEGPYYKEMIFEDTQEWDDLCEILGMDVPGFDANSLGSIMPCYPEEDA